MNGLPPAETAILIYLAGISEPIRFAELRSHFLPTLPLKTLLEALESRTIL